jgi:hypothetical protein
MNDIELTVGLDISDYEKSLKKVESSANQLARATAKYSREESTLNKLLKDNKISSELYARAITNLSSDFQDLQRGVVGANNQFRSFTKSLSNNSRQVNRSTREINRSGMMMQQTGYQVGDFLVQIQSGTNWMVAFGQQATQVAGSLTMLGGRMVALGTGLGIAIPLVTALGAAWMRTRKEAEETEDSLKSLKEVIGSLSGNVKILEQSLLGLTETYGLGAGTVRDYAEALNELKISQAQAALAETTTEFKEALESLVEPGAEFGNIFLGFANAASAAEGLTPAFNRLAEKLGISYDEAVRLQTELAILTNVPVDQLGERFQIVAGLVKEFGVDVSQLPPALRDALVAAGEVSVKTAELSAWMERSKIAAEGFAKVDLSAGMEGAVSGARTLAEQFGIAYRYALAISQMEISTPTKLGFGSGIEGSTGDGFGSGSIFKFGGKSKIFDIPELDDDSASGGGGSGGGSPDGIGAFAKSLIADLSTADEKIELWRETSLANAAKFNEKELAMLAEHGGAKALIDEQYNKKVQELEDARRTATLSGYSSLFGAIGNLMGSKGKKLLQIQAALDGASVMISSYKAAADAAAETPTVAGKLAVWAGFVAKGISTVAKIKSIGSSGNASGGSGGGGGKGISTAGVGANNASTGPVRILFEGLDANSLYSGEQISGMFDALFEENKERGYILQVAT